MGDASRPMVRENLLLFPILFCKRTMQKYAFLVSFRGVRRTMQNRFLARMGVHAILTLLGGSALSAPFILTLFGQFHCPPPQMGLFSQFFPSERVQHLMG